MLEFVFSPSVEALLVLKGIYHCWTSDDIYVFVSRGGRS